MSNEQGKIPIGDARRIARERNCPVVVVFGIEAGGDRFTVTSYGMNKQLCKLGAHFAEQIASAIFSGRVRPPAEEE